MSSENYTKAFRTREAVDRSAVVGSPLAGEDVEADGVGLKAGVADDSGRPVVGDVPRRDDAAVGYDHREAVGWAVWQRNGLAFKFLYRRRAYYRSSRRQSWAKAGPLQN